MAEAPAADEERARRVASAIARRVLPKQDEGMLSVPWHRLVLQAGLTLDSRHLIVYAVAADEPLVMAIADEVFYRRFVLGRAPEGFTEREFNAINTGKLLETDQVVTHRLVDEYARRAWGLKDETSTQCALRILREGGALAATWIARGEARCLAYFPSHQGPSWRVFAYALWDEFASHGRTALPRAYLRSMRLARLFSLSGPTVDALAERAATEGFGSIAGRRSGGRFVVAHDSVEDATEALAGRYAGGGRD